MKLLRSTFLLCTFLVILDCCASQSTSKQFESDELSSKKVGPSEFDSAEEISASECLVSVDDPIGSTSTLTKYLNRKDIYIVSTLDGRVTALDLSKDGQLLWSYSTNDDGLLQSSIGDFQFMSEAVYFKLVPALDGSLYKLNEQHNILEPIPLTADVLLKSSFKLGDDLLITGGKAVSYTHLTLPTIYSV